jgi:hypothetical protein
MCNYWNSVNYVLSSHILKSPKHHNRASRSMIFTVSVPYQSSCFLLKRDFFFWKQDFVPVLRWNLNSSSKKDADTPYLRIPPPITGKVSNQRHHAVSAGVKTNILRNIFNVCPKSLTLSIGSKWIGLAWRARRNPVFETLCFKYKQQAG